MQITKFAIQLNSPSPFQRAGVHFKAYISYLGRRQQACPSPVIERSFALRKGVDMSKAIVQEVEFTEEARDVEVMKRKGWRSYIWDSLDKSPEERKFLFKLDAVLLTFASLGKVTAPSTTWYS